MPPPSQLVICFLLSKQQALGKTEDLCTPSFFPFLLVWDTVVKRIKNGFLEDKYCFETFADGHGGRKSHESQKEEEEQRKGATHGVLFDKACLETQSSLTKFS